VLDLWIPRRYFSSSQYPIVIIIIIIILVQYSILDGKILKTKQVRPQRRLLGGESAVEGDRISLLQSHWQPLEHYVASLVSAVTAVIRRSYSSSQNSTPLG